MTTKELLNLTGKIIWLAFQAFTAFSVTFFAILLIPLVVILFVGVLGLLSIGLGGVIAFWHSPFIGTIILIAVAFICAIAAIVIAIVLTIAFALAMSFVALLVSALVDEILKHKGVTSWAFYFIAGSFAGALSGIPFGLLGLAAIWGLMQLFPQLQPYSTPTMIVIMAIFCFSGILAADVCGVTLGAMAKLRELLRKLMRST